MEKTFQGKKYLFLVVIIFFIYTLVKVYNAADWDLWARLAVGKIFFHTGQILRHDIFAYTVTKPLWIDHEWGSGVVFYALLKWFGEEGLVFLKFLLLFGIFYCVYETNQLKSREDITPYRMLYYFAFLMAVINGFSTTLRSQAFTYFFFALWIYLLEKTKKGNNKFLWIFPLTMLFWANLHGGFLSGLGLVALYFLGEFFSKREALKYLKIFVASAAVTLINPYGVKYWDFIIDAVSMNRPFVRELDPIDLFSSLNNFFMFKLFLVLSVISVIYSLIKRSKGISLTEILVLGFTLWLSLKHARHYIFFIIASASYIYYCLYPALNTLSFNLINRFYSKFPEKVRGIAFNVREFIFYGFILLCLITTTAIKPTQVEVNKGMFPERAVKFIEMNGLSGNLMVLFNWGSYALWKLYPQCLIAVDGRYEEVYPESTISQIARFHYVGREWDELVRAYHTDIMLVPVDYDVYKYLIQLKEWKIVYKDDIAAVFLPAKTPEKVWKLPDKKFDPNSEKFHTQKWQVKGRIF